MGVVLEGKDGERKLLFEDRRISFIPKLKLDLEV